MLQIKLNELSLGICIFPTLMVDLRSNLVNLSDAILERACDVNHKLINNNNIENYELICFDFVRRSFIHFCKYMYCWMSRLNNCNINFSGKKFQKHQLFWRMKEACDSRFIIATHGKNDQNVWTKLKWYLNMLSVLCTLSHWHYWHCD